MEALLEWRTRWRAGERRTATSTLEEGEAWTNEQAERQHTHVQALHPQQSSTSSTSNVKLESCLLAKEILQNSVVTKLRFLSEHGAMMLLTAVVLVGCLIFFHAATGEGTTETPCLQRDVLDRALATLASSTSVSTTTTGTLLQGIRACTALENQTVHLDVEVPAFVEYALPAWSEALQWPSYVVPTSSPGSPTTGDVDWNPLPRRAISVPAVDLVTRLYLTTRNDDYRDILMALLDAGADPNLVTPWTAADPPPLLQIINGVPFDVDLIEKFVNHGASLSPFVEDNSRHGRVPAEGVSYLHILHQSLEHVHLIKRFFVVADAGKRLVRDSNHNSNNISLGYVFQHLANVSSVHEMKDWQVRNSLVLRRLSHDGVPLRLDLVFLLLSRDTFTTCYTQH